MVSLKRPRRRASDLEAKVSLGRIRVDLEQHVGMRRQVEGRRPIELTWRECLVIVALRRRIEPAEEVVQRHASLRELVGPGVNAGVDRSGDDVLGIQPIDGGPQGVVHYGVTGH